jgi:parvulin-like peptidyl-prolyl isomerase
MIPSIVLLCVLAAPAPSQPLARVNGTTVSQADLDERLRVSAAQRRSLAPAQALADLVDEALLADEARRLKLDREPSVAEELDAQRRRLATDAYLAKLASATAPTEAQLREMYHATGDSVRLTLVRVETKADADAALARVKKGGDLAAEAKRGLDPGLAAKGGDTGLAVRSSFDPALAREAFRVRIGELFGPLQLQLGWAIGRVEERAIGDEAGFASRRPSIEKFAREQGMAAAKQHATAQLRQNAKITIDEKFLLSLDASPDLRRGDAARVVATANGWSLRYGTIYPSVERLYSAVRGHGARGAVLQLVNKEIDGALVAQEAIAKGFLNDPAVSAVLPAIERNILASAAAARVDRSAALDAPKVRDHVARLRAGASVVLEPGAPR